VPAGYEVSTESGSDRVSIYATVEVGQDGDPVATAPGTDLITLGLPRYRARLSNRPATTITITIIAIRITP
jgi:hypothetical protein